MYVPAPAAVNNATAPANFLYPLVWRGAPACEWLDDFDDDANAVVEAACGGSNAVVEAACGGSNAAEAACGGSNAAEAACGGSCSLGLSSLGGFALIVVDFAPVGRVSVFLNETMGVSCFSHEGSLPLKPPLGFESGVFELVGLVGSLGLVVGPLLVADLAFVNTNVTRKGDKIASVYKAIMMYSLVLRRLCICKEY